MFFYDTADRRSHLTVLALSMKEQEKEIVLWNRLTVMGS